MSGSIQYAPNEGVSNLLMEKKLVKVHKRLLGQNIRNRGVGIARRWREQKLGGGGQACGIWGARGEGQGKAPEARQKEVIRRSRQV